MLGGSNETKHDSVILKNSPKKQKGWNASPSVGPGYSQSCRHLFFSFRKHLPWTNRAGIDTKVKRGVTDSTHSGKLLFWICLFLPATHELSVPIFTDTQGVTSPRSHKEEVAELGFEPSHVGAGS